jgi:putative heme-binding domain-containing protein
MLALLSLSIAAPTTAAEQQADAIRVLIVTGIDYPGHHWWETTPVLEEELGKDPRMKVTVLKDPYKLDVTDLSGYAALLLHFMNWEKPDPNDKAKENLRRYVERGGGLVIIHFACGAFQGWPEYAALAGRIYDRTNTHDPRGPFTVNLVNTNHSLSRGMPLSFDTDDELYICLMGDKPIELLATARSKITKRDHPMGFVHNYGKGRVFLTPLGHDVKALRAAGTAELIRRATAWTAGREPVASKKTARLEPRPVAKEIENQFQLPAGFEIRLVAAEPDIVNPMTMCVDEPGALWVTEAHTYRWGTNGSPFQPPTNPIKRIELGLDGRAVKTIVAAEGFAEPVIGVHARDGKLYATCLNELFVMDIAPDGKLANRKLLVKDAAVPWNPFGMYRVQVGPDDKLWLCIADHPGSQPVTLTGFDGRIVRLAGKSGGLVRCNRDGSGLEIIVQGFRAPYAFDIDPWGHLWHISNGEGSPNLYVHVIPGMDYGYASRQASYAWLAGQEPLSPPVRDMGAGANTAALHYYSSQFPPDYWGNIFIANWGSHGANPANRDIRRFRRAKDGQDRAGTSDAELIEVEKFLTPTDPMFRPTGLALAPDGGLYLLDWHGRDDENDQTGRIFKITYLEPGSGRREEALINSESEVSLPTSAATDREVSRLGHPNHFVRELAQRALTHAGERALEPLGRLAETGEALATAGAIWTLSRIDSTAAVKAMTRALKHPDARVRAQAVRQLRQAAGQTLAADISRQENPLLAPAKLAKLAAPLLNDPDAEVRVEAALAQDSSAGVTQGLLAALGAAPNSRLLYQIGMQLSRHGDAASVLALVRSTNSEWQRAGLIALDTARYEHTPLAESAKKLASQVLEEVPPADFGQKLAWLQRHKPDLLAAEFARLESGELGLTTAGETLAALACLESSRPKKLPAQFLVVSLENMDPRVQDAALRVVRHSAVGEECFLKPTLKVLRSTQSTNTRLEAIFTLGSFGNAVGADEWLRWAQSPVKEVVAATLRSLRQTEHSADLANVLLEAAPALAVREPDLGEDLLLTLRVLGVQADQCGSLPIPKKAPQTKSELAMGVLSRLPRASATLGRLSFQSSLAGCAKCHSTKPGEAVFGPSLADIGAASQPEYLIESLLEPSKVIKTGFQTETIETSDGRVLSGLVEAANGQLLVKISPDEQVTVPLHEVKSRAASSVSPMPEGLASAMSEAELADVVAWLLSLKPAR